MQLERDWVDRGNPRGKNFTHDKSSLSQGEADQISFPQGRVNFSQTLVGAVSDPRL